MLRRKVDRRLGLRERHSQPLKFPRGGLEPLAELIEPRPGFAVVVKAMVGHGEKNAMGRDDVR
jgi:hypothetical protein